jgi:cell division protein FtsL
MNWYEKPSTVITLTVPLLILLLVMSALSVVYIKYSERQQYMRLYSLQKKYENFMEEQGRLRLEEAALGSMIKVEIRAREDLRMVYPSQQQRVQIK